MNHPSHTLTMNEEKTDGSRNTFEYTARLALLCRYAVGRMIRSQLNITTFTQHGK